MSKKVLIVEDETDILNTLVFAFRKEGYTCASAQTGPDAVMTATSFLPDLIVLDLNIPGLDGTEVCLRLKNEPKTEHIKIMMLTARGQREDKFLGKEVGADLYMTKPFDLEKVVQQAHILLT